MHAYTVHYSISKYFVKYSLPSIGETVELQNWWKWQKSCIQNSIILIQTTEYNNFMLECQQKHPDITLIIPVLLSYFLYHMRLYKYNIIITISAIPLFLLLLF